MEYYRRSRNSSRVLGLTMVIMAVMVAKQGTAVGPAYGCWGGCYNGCILQNGTKKSQFDDQKLPCYWKCLGSCISHSGSDFHHYCQLGCSLKLCPIFSSGNLKEILQQEKKLVKEH
ncbi:hypothetical protein Vadar_006569 [Vaccinium darrowii]|uniref:Uncharacterized protein n=1 Tax=Vaccinium darrowii TaxID=229202 RepID=A0ACB7XYU8_9ERIC|nr:hypothetical protein Vadar_006569 [Vaccinium darrowii]